MGTCDFHKDSLVSWGLMKSLLKGLKASMFPSGADLNTVTHLLRDNMGETHKPQLLVYVKKMPSFRLSFIKPDKEKYRMFHFKSSLWIIHLLLFNCRKNSLLSGPQLWLRPLLHWEDFWEKEGPHLQGLQDSEPKGQDLSFCWGLFHSWEGGRPGVCVVQQRLPRNESAPQGPRCHQVEKRHFTWMQAKTENDLNDGEKKDLYVIQLHPN